jgi:single-strand DNA-binding protein
MSDLNNVCLIGRVTRNVEIQYTAKRSPIYCFSITNNRNKQVNNAWKRVPHFFNFRLLGKRREGVSSWLVKGQLVSIPGRLEQDRWEWDGKKRSCLKIAMSEIQPVWPRHAELHEQSPKGDTYNPDDETEGGSTPERMAEGPVGEGGQ